MGKRLDPKDAEEVMLKAGLKPIEDLGLVTFHGDAFVLNAKK